MSIRDILVRCSDHLPVSFSLVDLGVEEQPLIHVNQQFCDLTGYTRDEIMGKNCRFLQGPETSPEDTQYIRTAIKERRAVFCDLINYTKAGKKFFNRLVLIPLYGDNDDSFYGGLQIDSSDLKLMSPADFDHHKMSENIKDRIYSPLTILENSSNLGSNTVPNNAMVQRAFQDIVNTVRGI